MLLIACVATLARIRQATGDAAGALDAIGEAGRVAPSPAATSLSNPVPAQRARLLLAQGDTAAAARWIQQRGLRADDGPGCPQEREYLVLAWVLLAQDRPGQAVALLDRLLAQAATGGRIGSVIQIRALQALAHQASRDEPAAMAALVETLTLACPQGHVRIFADGCPARPAGRRPPGKTGPRPVHPAQLPGPASTGVRRRT